MPKMISTGRTYLKNTSSPRCERFPRIRKACRGSCSHSYCDEVATQRDGKIAATHMGYDQFPQYRCLFELGVRKAHPRPCSLVLRKLAHIASGGIFEVGSITKEINDILNKGGVGVLPTDTLYGIVGSALSKKAVQRIYKLRRRNPKKPMIILVGSLTQLKIFGIKIDRKTSVILRKLWPGKVSVILPCPSGKWVYLHRGRKSLAFRLPRNKALANFIKRTGPLVAPTANFEGEPPAGNIKEAKRYFGNRIDFYVDAGRIESEPSTLVKIAKGKILILRAGAGKI